MLLKQSTAQTVVIGPILDADGVAVTTAVIGNISLAKNGTAAALTTETLTHLGNSYYSLALTASNTNTIGILAAFVNNTAWSMTVFRWNVIVGSAYDAIVNNATNASGGLLTATGSVSAIAGALLNTTNLPTNFSSLAITAGGAVTAGTVSDKTGYALSASGLASITSWTVAITGNITGNLSGSVGSVTSGVTVSTNNDKTGYSLTVAPLTAAGTASAVWDALIASYTVNGSFGARVIRSTNNNQNSVLVTGSNHVAADMHESQAGSIHATTFDAGAITSTMLATDSFTSSQISASAVTEIQAGLATSSGVTSAFTEIKGATWSSSTDTLEKIRDAVDSSGGGGDSIIVTPIVAQTPVRAVATNISTFKGDRSAITVGVFDELDPVDLTSLGALEVCIQTKAGTDLQVIANANITISGADNNYFSFSPGSAAVATVGRFMWSLRVAASNSKRVIAYGAWIVEDAALNDA